MCEALRELMADDLKEAENIGIEKGIEKGADRYLISLVCKKLAKGKNPEIIAEELEEDMVVVKHILVLRI